MRLFVGIFPSDDVLKDIRDVVRNLDKVKRNFRFIPYDQMHMTAKFIGARVSKESLTQISYALENSVHSIKPAYITLGDFSFGFPGQQRPNVIFINVYNNPPLDNLINTVNSSIKGLKLEDTIRKSERKRLTHHITVARAKRTPPRSLVRSTREILRKIDVPELSFPVEHITLVESQLTKTGPVYKKLAKFDIAQAR